MDELQENIEVAEPVQEVTPDPVLDAEIVDTPAETVEEPVVEATEAVEETEEVAEEVTEEVVEETPEVEEPAIIFDANEELPVLMEKVAPVLDKYVIPADVQAVIDALKTKAESSNDLSAFSDYGDEEALKTLLERQSYLDTAVEVENGQYRPNTDKFVESIADPEVKNWLYYDIGRQPSEIYPGATKFEETLIGIFAQDGEPPTEALARYNTLVEHLRNNTMPTVAKPSFVPDHLQEAYFKLSESTREELAILDPDFDDDRAKIESKVRELELIQRGIEGEKQEQARQLQTRQAKEQAFTQEVLSTQLNFYSSFRDEFSKDLMKTVQFHPDPKMQTLLANQQISLLTQAFEDGAEGDFARNTLAEAGINFDQTRAQQLLKDVEKAAVQLTAQKRAVGADGKPLNSVELNKAVKQFEKAGRNWQSFAKDILDQEARLVSTGTNTAVKEAAEKIKIAPKARQAPKGAPSAATKADRIPAYGTQARLDWFAERELERQRQLAEAYG